MSDAFRRLFAPFVTTMLAALLFASCITPRTQLLVTVASDIPWGADRTLRSVRVTVRDDGPDGPLRDTHTFTLGASSGQFSLPLSFGVLPRAGHIEGTVWIEVAGCGETCDATPTVVARAVASFVPREIRGVNVLLSSRCRYVACSPQQTCDADTGRCGDPFVTPQPVTMPDGGTEIVPDATPRARVVSGLEQSCVIASNGDVRCWGERSPWLAASSGPVVRAPATSVDVIRGALDLSVANRHACAVLANHDVVCVGRNDRGQLGDGTMDDRSGPVAVQGLASVIASTAVHVGVGWDFSCALGLSGGVACWGDNHLGQLGDGSLVSHGTPTRIPGFGAPVEQLDVGFDHACAVLATGAVVCWGRGFGEAPQTVAGLEPAAEVAIGWQHTCIRTRDQRVQCWGSNDHGQLGNGVAERYSAPRFVVGLRDVVTVRTKGFHTCAISVDGSLRCWGGNDVGQLGDATTVDRALPTGVRTPRDELTNVVDVAPGVDQTCALVRTDRGVEALCWGSDEHGETGSGRVLSSATPMTSVLPATTLVANGAQSACGVSNGIGTCWGMLSPGWRAARSGSGIASTPRALDTPRAVAGLPSSFASIALGRRHSCGRTVQGTVLCWGNNDRGQLGLPGMPSRDTPAVVPGSIAVAGIAAGADHTCQRLASDRVECWGANDRFQLGDGTSQDRFLPTAVRITGVTALAAGVSFSLARTADGAVWSWGTSQRGALGLGSNTTSRTPTRIDGIDDAIDVTAGDDHACILREGGRISCFGANDAGQLGDASTMDRHSPADVSGLRDAIAIAASGRHTCALTAAHAVRCWGANDEGELGDRSNEARSSPVEANVAPHADAIAVGSDFTCAIDAGRVSCWGGSQFGQRGGHTRDTSLEAFSVLDAAGGPLTDVAAIAAGNGRACASNPRGSFCWGINDHGQLGIGAWRSRVLPVAVHTSATDSSPITDAVAVSAGPHHTCVVRADGTAYCFGSNGDGRLGDGTNVDRRRPSRVAAPGVHFVRVSAGGRHSCGLDDAGSVWCWGSDRWAQSSAGGTSPGGMPARVTTTETAIDVQAGDTFTCALLASRRVECWGDNRFGELGRGDRAPHRDIARVMLASGSQLDTVTRIAVGPHSVCADRSDNTAWCWGDNSRGQVSATEPAVVTVATASSGHAIDSLVPADLIAVGRTHSCLDQLSGHSGWCWGANEWGQIDPREGTAAQLDWTAIPDLQSGESMEGLAVGDDFTCMRPIYRDGVYCQGGNDYGQLGIGTRLSSRGLYAVLEGPARGLLDSGDSHTCGFRTGSPVHCWGRNDSGQLGDGTIEGSSFAANVLGPSRVSEFAIGFAHRCAVINDRSMLCWGHNNYGQLGTGDFTDRDAPEVVTATSNVVSAASGPDHTCAVREDGAVVCWGRNDRLQLGAVPAHDAAPIEVPGVTGAIRLALGELHSCSLGYDGLVNCWGDDTYAQRGRGFHGSGPFEPDPTMAVPGLFDTIDLRAGSVHTCALADSGRVSCWGGNIAGQLGDGTTETRAAPSMVNIATTPLDATQIATGSDRRCDRDATGAIRCETTLRDMTCARERAGTIACWGANDLGQLGIGSRASVLGAQRVAGVSGATSLDVGGRHACAVTAAGRSCWGDNHQGQLVDGTEVVRVMPASVAGIDTL